MSWAKEQIKKKVNEAMRVHLPDSEEQFIRPSHSALAFFEERERANGLWHIRDNIFYNDAQFYFIRALLQWILLLLVSIASWIGKINTNDSYEQGYVR